MAGKENAFLPVSTGTIFPASNDVGAVREQESECPPFPAP
jgi:hypothetical protein